MSVAATWRMDRAAVRRMTHGRDGEVVKYLARRARRVETRAKILSPVDTGRMRSTIHLEGPRDFGGEPAFWVIANTRYSIFVHDGTRYMRARPFLADAIRQAFI